MTIGALVACSQGAPALPPPAGGAGWAMYRGDLNRDGHPATATLDAGAAARLALAWTGHLDGAVDGTPAIGGGLVVTGSAGGTLAAFDSTTGEQAWAVRGLGPVSGSPTIDGDRVYTASLTGHVYAFRLLTGARLWSWSAPPNSAVWASPVAYRDELIVGVASPYGDTPLVAGRLYGLDAATGSRRWTACVETGCAPGDGVWSTPAIDAAGTAFVGVGNPDDAVLAFDPSTGGRKWLSSLYADAGQDLDVGASPVLLNANGREVVAQATVAGIVALLDASTGSVAWSRRVVEGSAVRGLIASPAYDGTNLYLGSASPPTGIIALNPLDGSASWRHPTDLPVYSAPAAASGVVVFGTGAVFGDLNAGSVVAVSAIDGHLLWSHETHSAVRSGPAVAADWVIVGDNNGDVLAFRPR